MQQQTKIAFWRQTPPAVFPSLLGLLGLGIVWRNAGNAFGFGPSAADLWLGIISSVYVFALVSYGAKFIYRPRVIIEDLSTLPGRAGLAALTLAGMIFSAALIPHSANAARVVLLVALAGHLGLNVIVIALAFRGPADQRQVTPATHLVFVGFVVGAAPAAGLGMAGLTQAILDVTMLSAALIYAVDLSGVLRRGPPARLRPLLAIHLSPVSLFVGAAHLMGHDRLALLCAVLASATLGLLLARVRYLTEAGFSPLWGAFTFPLVAYVGGMQLMAADRDVFGLLGIAGLGLATLIVPVIGFRILRSWALGGLPRQTGAAVA